MGAQVRQSVAAALVGFLRKPLGRTAVAGFPDTQNPNVPRIDQSYVFRRETLRDILAYLNDPDGDGIIGDADGDPFVFGDAD